MKTDTLPAKAPAASLLPAPGGLSRRWLRSLLFFALVAIPAGTVIRAIATYAIDVPYWDQWETSRFFSISRYGHQSLLELARQQNESRLLFPNLIFLALSLPGNWSVVREMYFSVGLVIATSSILFGLLRRTGFSLLAQSVLLFAINWLLFALTQQENWFFGIQICYFLPPTMLCLALLTNVSSLSLGRKTLLCLGLAFVSSYSFSGGVIVCALAFPGLLPGNWSASGRWLPRWQELLWHALYIAVCAVMLMAYFWGYKEPGGAGSLLYIFTHLDLSLSYFFVWMGSPLAPYGSLPLAKGIGAFVFLLLVALLLAAVWQIFAHRQDQKRLYPWVILGGYAIGTGLATVIGRSGFGTGQALSSRYIIFSNFAYVTILVLGAYFWCFHRQRAATWARTVCLGAALLVLPAAGWMYTQAQRTAMHVIVDISHYRDFAAQGLVFMPLMPTSQNLDTLCGVSEYIRQHAMDLMRRGILDVPLVPTTIRDTIQKVTKTGNLAFGQLDQPGSDSAGRVSLRGWAINPARQQPAGRVLITCTDKSGVTRPLVAFVTDLYRPALAPAPNIYQAMPCAFVGLANFDRLPPGEYLVAAWAVDIRLNMVNQIGSAYPFTWARSGTLTRPLDSVVYPAVSPEQDNRNGTLEVLTPTDGNALILEGWAVDVNSGTVPKAVLLTCTDRAGVTRLVAHVGPGQYRRDVVDHFHNDMLTYSGYRVRADFGALPPGDYVLAGWGVGADDNETLVQLGGIHRLHLPLK